MGFWEDNPRVRLGLRAPLYLALGLMCTACTSLTDRQASNSRSASAPPADDVVADRHAVAEPVPLRQLKHFMRPVPHTIRPVPPIHPVLTLHQEKIDLSASLADAVELAAADDGTSLWPLLTREFGLDHHLNQRSVQDAVRKYTQNPAWLADAQARLSLYLPYFLKEIRRRNLPAELALVPIIESTLDPQALSPRGALGLWQFMPDTANRFGLSRDWWHDSRQDTVAATRAALDYLELLYAQFGDWLLTLAAYNAGEGTVARTLPQVRHRPNASTRFFEMRLPMETRNYVPRVLALAAIIKDPQKYDISLPEVSREVPFQAIKTDRPVDLQLAAAVLKVAPAELVALNPAYKRQATPPEGTHNLLVPARIGPHAQARLDEMARNRNFAPVVSYRVQRGDSLGSIARRFSSSVVAIRQLNALRSDIIRANATLQIPRNTAGTATLAGGEMVARADSPPAAATTYRVQRGDTLGTIARRFGTGIEALRQANNLPGSTIRANAVMKIPGGEPKSAIAWNAPPVRATTSYQVRAGDSLSTIASRYGIGVATLKAMNGLKTDAIRANRALRVPALTRDPAARSIASAPAQQETYHVRSGDTLWQIARRYAVSHQELMRVNGLTGNHVLNVGRELKIPVPVATDIAGG